MAGALAKLLSAGSAALSSSEASREALPPGALGDELSAVLDERNGFFAFESALLFRPLGEPDVPVLGIAEWNSPKLWKSSFDGLVDDVTFFAEDLFGCQFGLRDAFVVSFNPESGAIEDFARSIEEWAVKVIDDYNALTGYPLAHGWQQIHGPLRPGMRLVPLTPFVVGGEFVVENLRPVPEVPAMRFYGGLANVVSQVPDGGEVRIDIKNLERVLDREGDGGTGGS